MTPNITDDIRFQNLLVESKFCYLAGKFEKAYLLAADAAHIAWKRDVLAKAEEPS